MKATTVNLGRLLFVWAGICGSGVFGPAAMAQTTTWTNAGSGIWSDVANWANGLPTFAIDPVIANSGTAVVSAGVSGTGQTIQLGGLVGGGNGYLLINGGLLQAETTNIGPVAGSQGSALLSSGSWTLSEDLSVGSGGTGSLDVSGGTLLVNQILHVGKAGGTQGTVTISGGTTGAGTLAVGEDGTGTLSISGGRHSTNVVAYVGYGATGRGTMSVSSGTFSTPFLRVGFSGSGVLNISNGGMVDVSGTAQIGFDPGAVGTIRVTGSGGSQGTLVARKIVRGAGTASLEIDGGIVRAKANESDFLSGFQPGEVTIGTRGAAFATNGATIGISAALSGAGALTKREAGTLTLSGSNSYAGQTFVNQGTLLINGDNSATGEVVVAAGAKLGGTGTVSDVSVSGTLTPGNGQGMFVVAGNLSLDSTSTVLMEITGTSIGSFDQVFVGGTVAWDNATLQLVFSYAPAIGDSFDLFVGEPFWGGDPQILTNLGGGLTVDSSQLAIDGTITVVPEPAAGALAALGGSLLLWRRRRAVA